MATDTGILSREAESVAYVKGASMNVEITTKTIGPKEARELLDTININNRKIDWETVATYARQMTSDEWRFAADPIRISRTNKLLDGQQRLEAVCKSGRAQLFLVVWGLEDEAQEVMDTGRRRTPADFFSMKKVTYAGTAAAIVQIVMRYDLRNMLDTKYKIQPKELLNFYMAGNNSDLIDRAVIAGNRVKKMVPLSPAIAGGVHAIASRESEAFVVNEFFEKLAEGFGLEHGDPILAMRSWLMRRRTENLRTGRNEWFYMLMRTWNAWATGEEAFRVQLPRDGLVSSDQIPTLVAITRRDPAPVTEDNPAVTPYSRTRKEQEIRSQTTPRRRKAS